MNIRRFSIFMAVAVVTALVALSPVTVMAGGPTEPDPLAGLTLKPTCYGSIKCGSVVVMQEFEDIGPNTRNPVGSVTTGDQMGIYAWQRSQGLYGSVLTDNGSTVLWGWVSEPCVSYDAVDCRVRGGFATIGMPATGGGGYDWSAIYADDSTTAAYAALPAWG